jgi:hypothetical protein
LLDHLLGVSLILERWQEREALCLAGLCHSIYGTEAFRIAAVSLSKRTQVSAAIGVEAERIAYLFNAMRRDTLWATLGRRTEFHVHDRYTNGDVALSPGDVRDLVTVALANMLEQIPRLDGSVRSLYDNQFRRARPWLSPQAFSDFEQAYGAGSSLIESASIA